MIRAVYLRIHDAIVRLRFPLVAVMLLAVGVAVPLVLRIPMNMGFRSLFAEGDGAEADTEAFEAVFGQPSGAQVGILLDGEDLTVPFLRGIERLSAEVEKLGSVIEVQSVSVG